MTHPHPYDDLPPSREEAEEFPRCQGTIHVWSSIFAFGDTCACGRFSLSQGEDGRLRTVDALPPDGAA